MGQRYYFQQIVLDKLDITCKKWIETPLALTKINSEWIINLNGKHKTMYNMNIFQFYFLEKKTLANSHWSNLSQTFTIEHKMKRKKCYNIENKVSCFRINLSTVYRNCQTILEKNFWRSIIVCLLKPQELLVIWKN